MLRSAAILVLFAVILPARPLHAQILIGATTDGDASTVVQYTMPEMPTWSGAMPYYGGGSHVPSDTMGMLRLPQFAKELELVDDQVDKVHDLQEEMQKQTREIFRSAANLSGDNMGQMMQEAQRAIREKTEEKLAAILLPHQLQRLKQVKLQMQLRNQGVRVLMNDELASTLQLTEKQREELKSKQAESQRKLQERIQQLREQVRREVIEDVLNARQLAKLQEMSGEKYEAKQPDYRSIFSQRPKKTEKKAQKPQ